MIEATERDELRFAPRMASRQEPLPIRADPRLWSDGYLDELRDSLRGRHSWLASRRRRAHAACLKVIEWREVMAGVVELPPYSGPPDELRFASDTIRR